MRFMAILVALLSACGDSASNPGADAPPGDGSVGDADLGDGNAVDADPDAAGSTVRVEAISIDGPLAGVRVAFLDPSNATLAVVTTAADGVAVGSVPDGGHVIAASPSGDRAFLWRAVEPDDVLRARFDVATTMRTVTFVLPASGSGGTYRINTRCGASGFSSSLTVVMMLPASCTASDLIVQHYGTTGLWPQFLYVPAQALTDATVNLSGLAWVNTTSYPIVANGITVTSAQLLSAVRVGDVLADAHFYSRTAGEPLGTAQTSGTTITATGAEVVVRLVTMSGTVQLTWLARGAPPPAAFDGGDRIVSMALPGYNAATRTFSWSEGAVGDPIEAVRGTLVFTRPSLPDLTWEIVSPRVTPTSVVIPALPSELASVDPGATAAATRRVRGYTVAGAYDHLRQVMFGAVAPDALLPQSGSLRISDSTPP